MDYKNTLEYYEKIEEILDKFDKEAFPDKKEQQKGFIPIFLIASALGCALGYVIVSGFTKDADESSQNNVSYSQPKSSKQTNDAFISYLNDEKSSYKDYKYTCVLFGHIEGENSVVLIPARKVVYEDDKTYLELNNGSSNLDKISIPLSGNYLIVGDDGGITSYDLALSIAKELTDDTYKIYDFNDIFREVYGFDEDEKLSEEDVSKVLKLKND